MVLCLNLVRGSINTAVAEGMALAERVGMKQSDLLDVMSSSSELVTSTSKGKWAAVVANLSIVLVKVSGQLQW